LKDFWRRRSQRQNKRLRVPTMKKKRRKNKNPLINPPINPQMRRKKTLRRKRTQRANHRIKKMMIKIRD